MGKKQALSHFQIFLLLSPVLLPSCRPLYLPPVSTAAASASEEEEEEEEEEEL
jgi:predicted small lipoprotein YifL